VWLTMLDITSLADCPASSAAQTAKFEYSEPLHQILYGARTGSEQMVRVGLVVQNVQEHDKRWNKQRRRKVWQRFRHP
jgi:hypothetical protein